MGVSLLQNPPAGVRPGRKIPPAGRTRNSPGGGRHGGSPGIVIALRYAAVHAALSSAGGLDTFRLADELGVEERTVRRYRDEIGAMVPITHDGRRCNRRWRYLTPRQLFPTSAP